MIEIERVPSVTCDECDSEYVIITKNGKECDDCNRITVNTSDYIQNKKNKKEKLLNLNMNGEMNEVTRYLRAS